MLQENSYFFKIIFFLILVTKNAITKSPQKKIILDSRFHGNDIIN